MYIITLHIDIILKICIIIVLKYREINVGLLIHISVWLIHNMNYQVQFGININEIDVSSMKWSTSLGSQTNISLAPGSIYAFNFGSLSYSAILNMPWKRWMGWAASLPRRKGIFSMKHLLYPSKCFTPVTIWSRPAQE